MADAADSTPASGGQFALTVADLNTTVNHEPRIEDLKLGSSLGMKNPASAMRKLIERHREALKRLGEVLSTVEKTSAKGGRPGRTTWLNKRQALYLCTKSETPRATEATLAMVAVFDAHLAGRLAPPAAGPVPIAPVPFLPGPERLVSTLHLARALRRRHTGILRLADVLAAERHELLGTALRFATYLHDNGRPYRCFHMDRTGFDALMARIPSADGLAAALRDATLRGWPDEPAALPPPPAGSSVGAPAPVASAPMVERDGFAVMRIGGETLVVDMGRERAGAADRAVRLHQDGTITVGRVEVRGLEPARPPRIAFAAPPHPAAGGSRFEALVRVLGVVVTSQPAATPRDDAPERTSKPRRHRGRLGRPAAPPILPDLGRLAIFGTA